jgi:hypothetical protein
MEISFMHTAGRQFDRGEFYSVAVTKITSRQTPGQDDP